MASTTVSVDAPVPRQRPGKQHVAQLGQRRPPAAHSPSSGASIAMAAMITSVSYRNPSGSPGSM